MSDTVRLPYLIQRIRYREQPAGSGKGIDSRFAFDTTVLVLNDALADIRDDPEFGKKLYNAVLKASIGEKTDVSAGCYINAATVIETHHADGVAVVAMGRGHVWVATPRGKESDVAFRERVVRGLAKGVPGLVVQKRKVRS